MKITDLAIDDFIQVARGYNRNLTLERVKQLVKDKDKRYPVTIYTKETVSLNDIVPIPLSEEIFVKNGFQKLNDGEFLLKDQIIIKVGPKFSEVSARYEEYDRDYNSYNDCYIEIAIIHYVHELQHLLRSLGIEKEIEL